MGVGLWVIGTEKGEGGYSGTKLRPSCFLCLANAQQIKSGRNKMSAALQANECRVFACTHIECAFVKLLAVPGKCTANRSRLNWAVTRASRSTCTPRKHYCEMTDNTNVHVASCTCS